MSRNTYQKPITPTLANSLGRRAMLIVVVVGLALSVSAFVLAGIWSEEQKGIKLEEHASNYIYITQQKINNHIEALRNTRGLYAASREVERHEFHKFVSGIISRHVDLRALEWIPRVPHSQRAVLEAKARRDGLSGFQIHEWDSVGRLVRAKTRREYFPVFFLEPLSGNETALGFDLASNPVRRLALEQARDTGEAVSTARIRLVQETADQYGYLIFLPVYHNEAKINSVAQRRKHLLGFVLAVYRIGQMIEYGPPAFKTQHGNIDLYLYDNSAQGEDRFLYSSRKDRRNIPPITEDQLRTRAHMVKRLQLPGRTWLAYFLPGTGLTPVWLVWVRWWVLAGGLFLTGLLVLFLRSTLKHTSELARANAVLGSTKQKLSLHVQQTPLGVIEWNTNFEVVEWSPAAENIFGYTREEALGRHAVGLVSEGVREQVNKIWCALLENKGGHRSTYENITKDGRAIICEWYNTPLVTDNGEVMGVASLVDDVTEHKQAELALRRSQKMEAIGQLSGGVAHDFNNQLGVIIGYLDFLKDYAAHDDKPSKWVETATRATLRCMDLTRQLLTFSRRQTKEKTMVDLNATLKELETMIARSVTPEVEVQYYLSDALWPTEIDPGEFQDAILNLVINARDAMPGGGTLLIETSNKPLDAGYAALNPGVEPGDYVQLMLSDTGTGMNKETLEHVFEPFFTTKPEGKGTGLGMAMVYGFTKRYDGYIKLYSEPGVGTTIRLYLPRTKASASVDITENAHATELPTGNESILIVDDEVSLLMLADLYLSDLGYHTYLAETAAQALEILAGDEEIDLLFSDVVMPGGINGYELAQRATEQRPGMKVLLTSGFTSKTMAHNGLARFAAHLLNKPYRKDDLAQRIRLVLDEETTA